MLLPGHHSHRPAKRHPPAPAHVPPAHVPNAKCMWSMVKWSGPGVIRCLSLFLTGMSLAWNQVGIHPAPDLGNWGTWSHDRTRHASSSGSSTSTAQGPWKSFGASWAALSTSWGPSQPFKRKSPIFINVFLRLLSATKQIENLKPGVACAQSSSDYVFSFRSKAPT